MKILITGINSALGRAVADRLAGHEVVGLGRKEHGRFPTVLCDLREGAPALPTVDVCLHLAFATDPKYCREHYREAYRVNVEGTVRLLEQSRRFLFVSTGSVYGHQDRPLNEDLEPEPGDEYAAMKRVAEKEVGKHPNAAVLRYFFPYGPATKPGSLVNRLIGNIVAGKAVDLHEDGRPRINPIYVSDLAEATRIFCLGSATGVYNVAGGEVVSIKELAEMIGKAAGKRPLFRPSGKKIKDMVGRTEPLLRMFKPAVSLVVGVRRTVEYWMEGKNGRDKSVAWPEDHALFPRSNRP